MPERITVVLPKSLKERAVARAREQGISLSELVRRALESVLMAPSRRTVGKKTGDPFWDNLKVYEGGSEDGAARYDDYLYGCDF